MVSRAARSLSASLRISSTEASMVDDEPFRTRTGGESWDDDSAISSIALEYFPEAPKCWDIGRHFKPMIADEEEVVRALGESLDPSKCELGAETGSSLARVQEKMSPRISEGTRVDMFNSELRTRLSSIMSLFPSFISLSNALIDSMLTSRSILGWTWNQHSLLRGPSTHIKNS